MLHAHSGLRWVALALLIVAIVRAFARMKSGKYEKSDKMINLFAMVTMHLQVTLGAIVAFTTKTNFYPAGWMGKPMTRFFGLEHIVMMVLAAVLLTIGRKKAEKQTDLTKRHKTIAIWYLVGLIIILVAIPWPFRGFNNGWF
jgi:heme A synthase